MLTVIIDGYNFIFNSYFKVSFKSDELQKLREDTINFLSKYYNVKKNKVVVVFDGYNTDEPLESKYNRQNIEVVYSKKDEKADDVIIRLSKSIKGSLLVVTNDNGIRREVSSADCSCISIDEFVKLVDDIIENGKNLLYEEYDNDEEDGERRIGGVKKGNPHKLSKKERSKLKKIKKL
ncbi:MAG: NYN domain-containing protein [Deltaproteobacteria bacterium]|jgi:predicted RNA-binding protein with PIN domain|nr:NYN domain-containing protein [Deltaproteobacteria bacterium]MCL6120460.1 NYN domain-containing protein [Deltaproteobacteria bacterium]